MISNGNSFSSSSAGSTCSTRPAEGACAEAAIWSHWAAGCQVRPD